MLIILLAGFGCRPVCSWVDIPAGECRVGAGESSRVVSLAPFGLGRCEVTVREYVVYLNETGHALPDSHPQVTGEPSGYRPESGQGLHPITQVSRGDAESYCRWLATRIGKPVRLPTADEWEYSARAGRSDVRYGWGWGTPRGRACFGARGTERVMRYDANPFGLHDVSGNVAEWCAGEGEIGEVRGGSWADRTPLSLSVYSVTPLPEDYRNSDVGFRIRMEISAPSP